MQKQCAPTNAEALLQGLSSEEAARRLEEAGPNEPADAESRAWRAALFSFLANPLMVVLVVAGAASALLGEVIDAAIIVSMVVLGTVINSVQTFRSHRAVERLRAGLAPTATVLRDGDWRVLARRLVVPDDVIRLSAGCVVPADARLVHARDLHVNEAILTGESLPVEKEVLHTEPDERSRVLFGTSVVSGTGTAVVFSTGRRTEFGAIAASLIKRPPETEFERGARGLGFLIMKTVMFLVLFVVVVALVLGRPAFESILFAISLAVGLTPEFLPVISTVTLAKGAVRMAKEKVVVKNLASLQNFGSIDILCSDKTGTLTRGGMLLEQYLDALGKPDEQVFLLAYLNCLHETGVENPLKAAVLAHGALSPLDTAILGHHRPDVSEYRKLDEVPYDFDRRRHSVVVQREGERILITKGAPETIFGLCTGIQRGPEAISMTPEHLANAQGRFEKLSAEGFRVLAVAQRRVPERAAYHAEDERDLVLAGFLAFADPPHPEVREVLQALHRDGVQVKILTGDNPLVARHVCASVGLDVSGMVVGSELDRISDGALPRVAEETNVFARVTPAQKNRVLLALKRRHVVGFLGDGINDAPSLHAADVGISVSTAVEVARDAAEVILLERNLAVLHRGIIEGRKAFGNVVKYLLMGTSSNFGNMFSMAGAFIFLPFLPMLPTQILLNNFLYDLAQVTIPTDNVDPEFIRKPRRWDIALIRNFMLQIGPISSIYDFLTFFVLLRFFHATEPMFHTGWFVESLATQTLVIFVIRTRSSLLASPPSLPLTLTTLAVVLLGLVLPLTPLSEAFGFVRLPAKFYAFLFLATVTYLALVVRMRRVLVRARERA